MQDEIAQEVARALGVSSIRRPRSGSRDKARRTWMRISPLRKAEPCYRVARSRMRTSQSKASREQSRSTRDMPRPMRRWRTRGSSRSQLSYVVSEDMRKQASSTARPLVEKALALNPDLAEAYLARAELQLDDGLTNAAEADLRHAIALNPNYGMALERYADHLSVWAPDRYDEALALSEQARRVDPLTPRNHHLKALLLIDRGKIEEAEALFVQALGLAQTSIPRSCASAVSGNTSRGSSPRQPNSQNRPSQSIHRRSGCDRSWLGSISIWEIPSRQSSLSKK